MKQIHIITDGHIDVRSVPKDTSLLVTDWLRKREYVIINQDQSVIRQPVFRWNPQLKDASICCIECAMKRGYVSHREDWINNWQLVSGENCSWCCGNYNPARGSHLGWLIHAALHLKMSAACSTDLLHFLSRFFDEESILTQKEPCYENLGIIERAAVQMLLLELTTLDHYELARCLCTTDYGPSRSPVAATFIAREEGPYDDYFFVMLNLSREDGDPDEDDPCTALGVYAVSSDDLTYISEPLYLEEAREWIQRFSSLLTIIIDGTLVPFAKMKECAPKIVSSDVT